MLSQVPEIIKPLLEEYLLLLEERLPGFITGFYLHGSIALGTFNEHFSDIDFIALVSRAWDENDVAQLKEIHHTIQIKYPRWPLQGSYLQEETFLAQREKTDSIQLNYHAGTLRPITHFDVNDEVNWWLLTNRGITLQGPPAANLELKVDWEMLLANMKHNLNTYWAAFTYKPQRMAWLLADYGIQWVVLGVLRQFYTFKENDITSKTGAGEYGLTHLPLRWHNLIREALNIREGGKERFYTSRLGRAIEAIRFLRYLIQLCNSLP